MERHLYTPRRGLITTGSASTSSDISPTCRDGPCRTTITLTTVTAA